MRHIHYGRIVVNSVLSLFISSYNRIALYIGVSPVVPLVFNAAGKSKTLPPAIAIAAVSTIGFIGLLIGPPMIGFIAGLTSLKISFLILSFLGIVIICIGVLMKKQN